MLGYTLSNFRILAEYTSSQIERLKKLQILYARHVLNNENLKEAFVGTYLETNEKGVPLRNVNMETINFFQRYTDSHLLVSFANALRTKILQYLQGRVSHFTSYANDPQSLLCLLMLEKFSALFVSSNISEELLKKIELWKNFINILKEAKMGSEEYVFPHYEDDLPFTMQSLLSNIGGLLEQIYEEVQSELNRRCIANYLDDLANSTRLIITLGFEYVSNMLTYEKLPLDFNLTTFYDRNINKQCYKKLHLKSWFQYLYQFAASQAIKELLFRNKIVHYELHNLIENKQHYLVSNQKSISLKKDSIEEKQNKFELESKTYPKIDFLNSNGQISDNIINYLFRETKPHSRAKQTGFLQVFCETNQDKNVISAIKLLGLLEIIAQLTKLIRIASDILRQDGSLLAQQETKSQIQIFIELYQSLLIQVFELIQVLSQTLNTQLGSRDKQPDKQYCCNPNLPLCFELSKNLKQLQEKSQITLNQIQKELLFVDKHRYELSMLLKSFKKQWSNFVGEHQWLLNQSQVNQLKNPQSNEQFLIELPTKKIKKFKKEQDPSIETFGNHRDIFLKKPQDDRDIDKTQKLYHKITTQEHLYQLCTSKQSIFVAAIKEYFENVEFRTALIADFKICCQLLFIPQELTIELNSLNKSISEQENALQLIRQRVEQDAVIMHETNMSICDDEDINARKSAHQVRVQYVKVSEGELENLKKKMDMFYANINNILACLHHCNNQFSFIHHPKNFMLYATQLGKSIIVLENSEGVSEINQDCILWQIFSTGEYYLEQHSAPKTYEQITSELFDDDLDAILSNQNTFNK